jgi:hypothetical protein
MLVDTDSDGTIDEPYDSSVDLGSEKPCISDIVERIPSSPDISVCDSFDYRESTRSAQQISTPQLLQASLLQRRLHLSSQTTPFKPTNPVPLSSWSPGDSFAIGNNMLESKLHDMLENDFVEDLPRQERVYLGLLRLLQGQKQTTSNRLNQKVQQCELALVELQKAQLQYTNNDILMKKRNIEYQEMRKKLWDIQSQITFAKQDVQSSILMNQQIFEECVYVSKQLEEAKMDVNQKVRVKFIRSQRWNR